MLAVAPWSGEVDLPVDSVGALQAVHLVDRDTLCAISAEAPIIMRATVRHNP